MINNQQRICPVCGTGKCQFRDGIMCRSYVCASGIFKGETNERHHKGADKIMDLFNSLNITNTQWER